MDAKIPVAIQALVKVVLPIQDLWSCNSSDTHTLDRNCLFLSKEQGSIEPVSSILVVSPLEGAFSLDTVRNSLSLSGDSKHRTWRKTGSWCQRETRDFQCFAHVHQWNVLVTSPEERQSDQPTCMLSCEMVEVPYFLPVVPGHAQQKIFESFISSKVSDSEPN